MKFDFAKLILISGLLAAVSAQAGSVVTVKPAVEIDLMKTDITLSDVVATQGLSRTAIDRFKAIKLSDAPAAGESRTFSKEVIASSIEADLLSVERETGEQFEIKIPSRVTVSKRKPSLGVNDLKQQLLAQFKALCADCQFEISNLSAPIAAKLPANTSWILKTKSELPKGSFSYPIEILSNDVVVQTYWVSGQLSIRRSVLVAAREIAMGERLQPEDLVVQIKDITFSSDAPIAFSELPSGVATRQIAAGQIVFKSNLRRELAIRSGDVVKVMTGNDQWEISLDGIAQTSGYVGDQVKVKIPKTQKLVSGLLRVKGVVEVQ